MKAIIVDDEVIMLSGFLRLSRGIQDLQVVGQFQKPEEALPGYEQRRSGSVEEGFCFTNSITGKISVPVTKKWVGPAAESVTVELLADGEKVGEALLSETNGWQYTFADLERCSNGAEIVYTVREVDIAGYSGELSGSAQEGFVISNTKCEDADGHEIAFTISEEAVAVDHAAPAAQAATTAAETKAAPAPAGTPATGDDSHTLFFSLTMLLSGAGLAGTCLLIKRRLRQRS